MNRRRYWDRWSDEVDPILDDPEFPRGTSVRVEGFGVGVAWRVDHVNPTATDWVEVIMVGDDRPTQFERHLLIKIEEDSFCGVCGQIGCTHDGR